MTANSLGPAAKVALWGNILMPLLYGGVQVALAPRFPDYDFMRHPASLLGSDLGPDAAVFNAVALTCGALAIVGGGGFWLALKATPTWIKRLLVTVVMLSGASHIWAGLFPMPDPRHGASPFMAAMLAVPFVTLLAALKGEDLRGLRGYLIANLVAFAGVLAVRSGAISVDLQNWDGLVQRVAVIVLLVPPAVAAATLLPVRAAR